MEKKTMKPEKFISTYYTATVGFIPDSLDNLDYFRRNLEHEIYKAQLHPYENNLFTGCPANTMPYVQIVDDSYSTVKKITEIILKLIEAEGWTAKP
jgi:hypothetical protein